MNAADDGPVTIIEASEGKTFTIPPDPRVVAIRAEREAFAPELHQPQIFAPSVPVQSDDLADLLRAEGASPCVACNLPFGTEVTEHGPWCGNACRAAYERHQAERRRIADARDRRDAVRAAVRAGHSVVTYYAAASEVAR